MTVTKLSPNRIRIEAEHGLIYRPSQQPYRAVECSCAMLALIEELTEPKENIADLLKI